MPVSKMQRRQNATTLTRLKSLVSTGEIAGFEALLRVSANPSLLQGIREQKLVPRADKEHVETVISILKPIAQAQLASTAAAQYENYLDFCRLYRSLRSKLLGDFEVLARGMPMIATAALLEAAQLTWDRAVETFLPVANPEASDLSSVADMERGLHHHNGRATDIANAIARAVNEASRFCIAEDRMLQPATRRSVEDLLVRMTSLASYLNSVEWIFDSVSYGDLAVSHLDEEGRVVTLDYVNPRHSLLRTLAIRRELVLRVYGTRVPRLVRQRLRGAQRDVLAFAFDFFSGADAAPEPYDEVWSRLEAQGDLYLASVEAEDDLLLAGATDLSVSWRYFAAMCLRWCMIGASAVRERSVPRRAKALRTPAVPLSSIAECVGPDQAEELAHALEASVVRLPVRHHSELMRRSFVLDGKNVIRPFVEDPAGWNVAVRAALLQGGELADRVGKLWEEFQAKSFIDTGWHLIGQGVPVKSNGELLTDIDLLLLRDDLLLVMQVKTLIGSLMTMYDHWKNTATVEWGCAQARIAVDALRRDKQLLKSLLGRKRADKIQVIEPVVLTNIGTFEGWMFDDVPVIAETGRKAITVGSKVDYVDASTKEVISSRHFLRRDEMNTESILKILRMPIELRIADETSDVDHVKLELPGITFLRPEFRLRSEEAATPPAADDHGRRYETTA